MFDRTLGVVASFTGHMVQEVPYTCNLGEQEVLMTRHR